MSLHHDIARAERQHAPRKHLRDELVKQTTAQIAQESGIEKSVTGYLEVLHGALEGLMKIWADDDNGRELVQKQIASITRAYLMVSLLRSALKDKVS